MLGSSKTPTEYDLKKVRFLYDCSFSRKDIGNEDDEETYNEDGDVLEAEFNREEAEAADGLNGDDDGDDVNGGGDDGDDYGSDDYGQYEGQGASDSYEGGDDYGTY